MSSIIAYCSSVASKLFSKPGPNFEFCIGTDFSPEPSGAKIEACGERSGEALRKRHLLSLLSEAQETNGTLVIRLDKVEYGYSAAFLQEAFAGLVTNEDFSAKQLKSLIRFQFDDSDFGFYSEKIWSYIDKAEQQNRNNSGDTHAWH